jgi:dTDP-4-amino-4,6-dideoxygalactose transaminase
MKIPIAKPLCGDEELYAIQRPIETGWVVQGPYVAEFERKFAEFTGVKHAVAVSNCTTALHVAMTIMGVGPRDEVIVPAFTWVATANAVEYLGGRPVFCDIDLRTFNIDVAQIEACITPRTVGIVAVHLFGLCADLDPILEIAKRRGLWVVEDAACAFGSAYRRQQAGTIGDIACFSFHPRKSITTGEGGMVTTASGVHAAAARSLRDHGVAARDASSPPFLLADYDRLGYNYRMTDFQGALGCAQMDRAVSILERRRACARWYDERLAEIAWLATPAVPDGYLHTYQAYVCLLRPEAPSMENVERLSARRNELMAALDSRGIATRQGTHAPIDVRYYCEKYNLHPSDFPNAHLAQQLSLAIPLYAQMTEEEREHVRRSLIEAY